MIEEAKDVLALSPDVCEALQHAESQFNVVVLLSKTFEKAQLEPPKVRSLAWNLFILARGTDCNPLLGAFCVAPVADAFKI